MDREQIPPHVWQAVAAELDRIVPPVQVMDLLTTHNITTEMGRFNLAVALGRESLRDDIKSFCKGNSSVLRNA